MTKSAFRCVQIVLLFYGVFGADEDDVSVIEGDSVTLPTNLTQIQGINLIEWKFRGPVIAQINGKDISYPSDTEMFRDRLQLDQTGSLTIKNMKTKHSGLYELKISHNDGTTDRKFNVTVYESTSDPGESEMKSESVKEGDRVTLQTGVTQISGEELIVWRFGDEGKVIAKADKEAKSSPLYYDERFRDRLELDQTGSLTITDTRSTDSGFYSVKITGSRTRTVYKRFSVSVSEPGLSSGGKAGIVLLVLAAVVAAAAAGFIYHRRKISELQKQTLIVTVTKGEDVILKPNKTIQKGDFILWMFGDKEQQTSIAKFIRETGEIVTHDNAVDGRFKGRLDLDKTGSLTIRKSRPEHSGLYTLHITSSSGDSQQRFIVTVSERVEEISVDDGDTVTLNPDTEIQEDDRIQWMLGEEYNIIAEIREETGEICDDVLDGGFKGRLNLEKTGSLTITDITPECAGLYKLQISSSRGTLCKRFRVHNPFECNVTEGESVHLSTDRPKIERDDVIEWMFGDEIIAEIKEGTGKTHDGADERFRDRLQLDKITGDLTIKNCTDEDDGDYKLKIISRKGDTNRTYGVIIRDEATGKPLMKENNDESVVEMQPLMT